MLIQIDTGRWINSDEIEEIRSVYKDEHDKFHIFTKSLGCIEVFGHSLLPYLDSLDYEIIPSVPGFKLIRIWHDDGEYKDLEDFKNKVTIETETIIAWRINKFTGDETNIPITHSNSHSFREMYSVGYETMNSTPVIYDPCGELYFMELGTFKNMNELLQRLFENTKEKTK